MATTVATRLKAKTISPSLTVDDLQQSIRFFEALGFAVEERWEEGGVLLGVMLKAGEVGIGISQDDWKKGRGRQKGIGTRLYIGTSQNIDDLAAQAKAAGVTVDGPHDTPWGKRAFDVTEPSGVRITITSE